MGSTERIRNVAKRVAKWARAGHQMVVVPSAMSGETNRLLGLAKELAPSHPDETYRRELDALVDVAAWISAELGRDPASRVARAVLAKRAQRATTPAQQ